MPGVMKKVRIICNQLTAHRIWKRGEVAHLKGWHAAEAVKDGTAEYVPDDTPAVEGAQREYDRLDVAIQKQDYELAKGIAQQEGMKTPDPALDPKKPAQPTILPGSQVAPLGDFQPPSKK